MTTSSIASSIGSIDTTTLVSQLMELQRQPLTKLKEKEADYQAKLSAYGTMLSAISTLKSTVTNLKDSGLLEMSASVSDSQYFTATASSSANAGTYSIKITNIATSQNVYSTTFSEENSEVADLTTYGAQKIKIQVGSGEVIEITIDSSNNTLSGIKDAINNAGAGVAASVINDGTGYRLLLSTNSTGASNRVTVMVDEDNNGTYEEAGSETDATGLSKLAFNATYDADGNVTGGITNMTQSQASLDASLTVNGLAVTRSGNTITDLITGVTINLVKESSGSSVSLSVSRDTGTLKAKLNSFVSAYNQVQNTIKALRGTQESSGILRGNSTLLGLYNILRDSTTIHYNNSTLALAGLTHDKNGVLSLNTTTLDSALSNSEADVTGTLNSMASSMETTLADYINTIIPASKDGYQRQIKSVRQDETDMEKRLELTETALKKKYAALDNMLNQLQNTSSYLTMQMDALSNLNK
ncbi:MAG: flagellar filament capping protein FliD [Syntrophorhabdaceae bacterium]|nr:flagellar filament capping protein FliD [Syntrophorhabdaceae bacterium]